MRGVQVAFLVATTATFINASMTDSRLSLQCKNIARDVIINSCKGPRNRRSTELAGSEKTVLMSRLMEPYVLEADGMESRQRKRPMYYTQPKSATEFRYGYGYEEENYMPVSFHRAEQSSREIEFVEESFNSRLKDDYKESFMPMTYQPMEYGMRQVRSGEILGFSLNSEELDDLFEEIGDRMPRGSKDHNKKIFQHVAAICCSNAKLCYDNPGLIPCMGY